MQDKHHSESVGNDAAGTHGHTKDDDLCVGSGRQWQPGTGAPVCWGCHAGPNKLGTKKPLRRNGRFTGVVPPHKAVRR